MAASVRVILSARAAWEVANDVAVVENVRTASIDGQKVPSGNHDMLRRWYGSARHYTVCRGSTGAMGP